METNTKPTNLTENLIINWTT